MIKMLTTTELAGINGGFKHNIWYYYGWEGHRVLERNVVILVHS